jgi:hypothetical protein
VRGSNNNLDSEESGLIGVSVPTSVFAAELSMGDPLKYYIGELSLSPLNFGIFQTALTNDSALPSTIRSTVALLLLL